MNYRDYEIFARVWESHSDLYTLDENGNLNESLDILINHDDKEVVWYEVEDSAGEMFKSIEDAKRYIDREIREFERLYGKEA